MKLLITNLDGEEARKLYGDLQNLNIMQYINMQINHRKRQKEKIKKDKKKRKKENQQPDSEAEEEDEDEAEKNTQSKLETIDKIMKAVMSFEKPDEFETHKQNLEDEIKRNHEKSRERGVSKMREI